MRISGCRVLAGCPTDRSGRVGETERQQRSVLFAREGAKVLCADVNEDAANETVQVIRQENGTANAICADVTSHDRRLPEYA